MADIKAIDARIHREVFSQGRYDVLDELCTPDFVAHDPNSPTGDIRGIEAYKAYVKAFRDAIPDLTVEDLEVVAEGPEVASRMRVTGTHTGDVPGIPASGGRIDITSTAFIRFADGREAEAWLLYDAVDLFRQMGVA